MPKLRYKYFSKFFKNLFTVVEYIDDNNFYFKVDGCDKVFKNGTPLSYFEKQGWYIDLEESKEKQEGHPEKV